MIPFKTPLVVVSTLIVTTLLLSWTFLEDYGATSTTSSSLLGKISQGRPYLDLLKVMDLHHRLVNPLLQKMYLCKKFRKMITIC